LLPRGDLKEEFPKTSPTEGPQHISTLHLKKKKRKEKYLCSKPLISIVPADKSSNLQGADTLQEPKSMCVTVNPSWALALTHTS
jgi:hypothetical protein